MTPPQQAARRGDAVHQDRCIVCDSDQWLPLPSPTPGRSMRSDGTVVAQPLLKAQCAQCGLVQSQQVPDSEALTALYTDDYDIYNNRPAAEQFVANRYTALAEAITSAVSPCRPERVLEAGCGNGAALQAVQAIWRDAACVGVEPVLSAVRAAQAQGINVHQGMIGVDMPAWIAAQRYDVIYTVHVIEHTQDPVRFLTDLKAMLAPHGRLVITCPNSCVPNLELMRADHHFSMTPYHLDAIARKAGLAPVKNTSCPGGAENLDCEHNQLLVCAPAETEESRPPLPAYLDATQRSELFAARARYFAGFRELDDTLHSSLADAERVFCFGSGGWACVLAGYAPRTWSRVEACIIDGGTTQRFHGKPILAYENFHASRSDKVIVGTNPAIQPMLAGRLEQDGLRAVRWDHLVGA